MRLSTVSAIPDAEPKRAHTQAWWTVMLPVALYAAWSLLMFLLLVAARPRTAFSVDYIVIMALWYVGWRLIAVQARPSNAGARAAASGEVF